MAPGKSRVYREGAKLKRIIGNWGRDARQQVGFQVVPGQPLMQRSCESGAVSLPTKWMGVGLGTAPSVRV